jgi:GAF domain-containing protein
VGGADKKAKSMTAADLLTVLGQAGQPHTLYAALDRVTKDIAGHQLFTLLYVDGDDVVRAYSNRPVEYPVSGRKPMGKTPWGEHVLRNAKPYLGRNADDIRWAFFDHALIESMGLRSVVNIPVIYDGLCLGAMTLLDAENHYDERHVEALTPYAQLLIPAFTEARKRT